MESFSLGVVISCEHASNLVPSWLEWLFAGRRSILESSEAFDPGARQLALSIECHMAEQEDVHVCQTSLGRWTRLICDLNRSEESPELWSEYAEVLTPRDRNRLLREYYQPFRAQTVQDIHKLHSMLVPALHLSVHTFEPYDEDKQERQIDLGILYDPNREKERLLAKFCREQLKKYLPELRVFANRPWRGDNDAHISSLREMFSEDDYIGLGLLFNQGGNFPSRSRKVQQYLPELCRLLYRGLFEMHTEKV